ncbi:MAG: hypothetical protein FWE26_04560 [Coriobacteriia bacterium]|nr:hypothetical protein [Coriobacteriia bacterium]MCL2870884.1 hypothetical protein [Coriobacteriia bacterium]
MRTVTIKREKSFLGKWLDYYVILDIPQGELAEYTGVKKYALGFAEGLVKGSHQIFVVGNDKAIRFKAPSSKVLMYAVYFDSSGIRFGEECKIEPGESDLKLSLRTKMGLSANRLVLSKD